MESGQQRSNLKRVTGTEPRDKVLNSPEFDPDVGAPDLQRVIEAYYGHR